MRLPTLTFFVAPGGIFVWLFLWMNASLCASDRILLRELKLLQPVTVVSFNVDGILLAEKTDTGTTLITWDEIESLQLEQPEQQAAATKMLHELGPSLYAVRHRLVIQDWWALSDPAEKMYPLFRQRQGRTAFTVCRATMLSRIARQQREAAVEPWLRAFAQWQAKAVKFGELPGQRLPQHDPESGLNLELEPVWFNPPAAREQLPHVAPLVKDWPEPKPEGALLYLASLAIAAEDLVQAETLLTQTAYKSKQGIIVRKILQTQLEIAQGKPGANHIALQTAFPKLSKFTQPLALWWLSQAELKTAPAEQRDAAILHLLRLPASHGKRSPELAAAALYQAYLHYADDAALRVNLAREILEQYPHTWHAAQLLAEQRGRAKTP